MDNEIHSPPFPKNADSPYQLYSRLYELYDWVTTHKDWANMEASRLGAPESPFVVDYGPYPPKDPSRFLYIAVPDMFVSWQTMRALREKYDDIVRNYEDTDSWNSDPCIFHRINLVKMASMLLSMAFLDREKREAREAELIKQNRKQMIAAMKKAFGDLRIFVAGEDNDEIDFDSLFNPETDDE